MKSTLAMRWSTMTLANKIIVSATAVIAIATVCNVAVAYFQWRVMRGSDQETRNLVAAATRQASAVESSAAETKRMTEMMNAAYLRFSPPSLDALHRFGFINDGNVPAFGVEAQMKVTKRSLVSGRALETNSRTLIDPKVPPRDGTTKEFAMDWGSANSLYENNEAMFFSLKAKYNDGFGHQVTENKCGGFFIDVNEQGRPSGGTWATCDFLNDDPRYKKAASAEQQQR